MNNVVRCQAAKNGTRGEGKGQNTIDLPWGELMEAGMKPR